MTRRRDFRAERTQGELRQLDSETLIDTVLQQQHTQGLGDSSAGRITETRGKG